jgi:hypothetical protein
VLYSGFDAAAVDKARDKVQDFRAWIAGHKDELTALQVLYASTRPLKLALKDLRQLKDALARPPATPVQLWRAFEAVEADKVKGSGGQQLADREHSDGTVAPSSTYGYKGNGLPFFQGKAELRRSSIPMTELQCR